MKDKEKDEIIGGHNWKFSDEIYFKLTHKQISSEYNPTITSRIIKIKKKGDKNIFLTCWGAPTFKDIDCNYIFHVYDKDYIEYVVSTSSGNTVEGLARNIKKYNEECNKNIKAILLVPEISAYKVSSHVIKNNPFVKYVVLKNSTLDSIRVVATDLIKKMSDKYNVVCADADLKTAAYSQIGILLNHQNLMNEQTCYVQTVSGGVGPTGFIEAAYKLNVKPEILLTQPKNGNSTPIIDALNVHEKGRDPILAVENGNYETSTIETTLGSTKPIYAIKKYVQWRERGGRINGASISKEELLRDKDKILNILVEAGIYPNKDVGNKLFDLEKSGFIAIIGALKSIDLIETKNIVINFTGRNVDPLSKKHVSAKPHLLFDPSRSIDELLNELNLD